MLIEYVSCLSLCLDTYELGDKHMLAVQLGGPCFVFHLGSSHTSIRPRSLGSEYWAVPFPTADW